MIRDKAHDVCCDKHMLGLCVRTQGEERRFTKVEARNGKVELDAWLNGRYEILMDVTPDEAYELAVKLVEQAELATAQKEEEASRVSRLREASTHKRKRR